jgi:hypothetical protein
MSGVIVDSPGVIAAIVGAWRVGLLTVVDGVVVVIDVAHGPAMDANFAKGVEAFRKSLYLARRELTVGWDLGYPEGNRAGGWCGGRGRGGDRCGDR